MSYIGLYKHELVGYINGLPIYHPLETVKNGTWGNPNFSCSPENLIIGGGFPEHSALVIHNLGSLAAQYILLYIEVHKEYLIQVSMMPPQKTIDRLGEIAYNTGHIISDSAHETGRFNVLAASLGYSDPGDNLEFCGWDMSCIRDFVELSKSKVHFSPLLEEDSPEDWIEYSIGEFVYFSLPELNPLIAKIKRLPGIVELDVSCLMLNVTCPPPNYINSKKKSLQGSGNGFFRWEYAYPPNV